MGSPRCCGAAGFNPPRRFNCQEAPGKAALIWWMLARLLENPFKTPGLKQHRSCATLLLPQEVFAWLCLRGCCRKQQWEKGNFCERFGAELAEVLGDISSSQGAQLGLSVSPLQVWVLQLCVPPRGVITTDITFIQAYCMICGFQKRIFGRSSSSPSLQLPKIWCGQLLPSKRTEFNKIIMV